MKKLVASMPAGRVLFGSLEQNHSTKNKPVVDEIRLISQIDRINWLSPLTIRRTFESLLRKGIELFVFKITVISKSE